MRRAGSLRKLAGFPAPLVALALALLLAGCTPGTSGRAGQEDAGAPQSTDSREAPAPRGAPAVEAGLLDLTADFRGDVGIYVQHLATGQEVAIRADEAFPTASMIKVPIMLALFDRIAGGELGYHEHLTYDIGRRRGDEEDLLASFADGEEITLRKLVMLMISFSDNTASLWCQELAGGGAGVNAWLAENGYEMTRVNSRTPGRESDYEAFGWGQTSPREIAQMLVSIRDGAAVDSRASDEMYRVLSKSFWDGEALSQLPPGVEAASKQGAVNRSRSEIVLVNAPSGDYVFAVITKNQEDTSWGNDNEGFVLLRRVSRLLWEHFEPGHAWEPDPASEAYW